MSLIIFSIVAIIILVFVGFSYYLRGIREERERILDIIRQTWAGRKQSTVRIMFMIDFKKELERRITE